MENTLRRIGALLIVIISSFFIFTVFLGHMKYPGGAVGMVPLILLYSAVLSVIPTVIVIGLIGIKRKVNIQITVLTFLMVYHLITYFYFEIHPFDQNNDEMDKNVDLWIYFSVIISSGLLVVLDKLRKVILDTVLTKPN